MTSMAAINFAINTPKTWKPETSPLPICEDREDQTLSIFLIISKYNFQTCLGENTQSLNARNL
jgi:hypothetical protein